MKQDYFGDVEGLQTRFNRGESLSLDGVLEELQPVVDAEQAVLAEKHRKARAFIASRYGRGTSRLVFSLVGDDGVRRWRHIAFLSPGEGQQLLQNLRNNVNAARRQLKTAEAMVSMASAELRQTRFPDEEQMRKEA